MSRRSGPQGHAMLQSRDRRLAEGIVECTHRLVDLAQRHAWQEATTLLSTRRFLVAGLRKNSSSGRHASCNAALRSAVAESDRVLVALLPMGAKSA